MHRCYVKPAAVKVKPQKFKWKQFMSQIYIVNLTIIKKIKLLGILFRFVQISAIAKYFFSSFDSKKRKDPI